ncbi:MAG: hypothetical protein IT318_04195 [Anaerolineales bacterium]|nr:hypothetical protein [Anaerolineales bacterium]
MTFKHVGKWTIGGRSVLLKFAVRTDPDWRRHLRRSWKRRRYWAQGLGRRNAYRAQVLALIVEWHVRPARAGRAAGGLKRG